MAESILDHAICDYEGTSYRARFWDGQGREYEDLAERIALSRLLPPCGRRIVEIGAGFGRLAELYAGYEQVVLLDYAVSGLREAQERLGTSGRFVYVAADLYQLAACARHMRHSRDSAGAASSRRCAGGFAWHRCGAAARRHVRAGIRQQAELESRCRAISSANSRGHRSPRSLTSSCV